MIEQIKQRVKLFVEANMFDHIVCFAYFCDRQAKQYVEHNPNVDESYWEPAYWAAARAAAGADSWNSIWAAGLAAKEAADAAACAANTEADARREQLEFLEWIWATSKQHWQNKKFKKVGGIVL